MARSASAATRQHHIEALARRAALQQGEVRRLLDERLQALQALALAPAPPCAAAGPAAGPGAGPLASLLAHIAQHSAEPGDPTPRPQAGGGTAQARRELKAVRDYRSTWSRLSVEQRVNQALARVPNNAGPLNTQRLVHQALKLLRDTSPAYMHRLVTQVEALLWLEAVGQGEPGNQAGIAAKKKSERAEKAAGTATGSARS